MGVHDFAQCKQLNSSKTLLFYGFSYLTFYRDLALESFALGLGSMSSLF